MRKAVLLGGFGLGLSLVALACFQEDGPTESPERPSEPAPMAQPVTPAPAEESAPVEPETSVDETTVNQATGSGTAPPKPRTISPESPAGVPARVALAQDYDLTYGPAADGVVIQITSPQPGVVLARNTVDVRVQIQGFRTYKTARSGGNHLRVLLDNEDPRDWYDPRERPLNLDGLAPGLHTVRVFAVTPWQESIKGPQAFDAVNFYVHSREGEPPPVDFSRPLLSYSVPLGLYQDRSSHRVLLDFHLANVTLGPTSYRVRLELDGESPVDFMHWSPVWLEGLAPGSHSVKLSLLNAEGRSVPGPYNVVEHTFRIQREE